MSLLHEKFAKRPCGQAAMRVGQFFAHLGDQTVRQRARFRQSIDELICFHDNPVIKSNVPSPVRSRLLIVNAATCPRLQVAVLVR
jgi:uncharacterized protein YajQ (UPF0234 family)